MAKACKAINAAEKELGTCEKMLEKKQNEFEANLDRAKSVKDEYERAKQLEEEKSSTIRDIEKQCEGIKKQASKIKCAEVDLIAKMDTLKRQIHDYERKIDRWEDDIRGLHQMEEECDEFDFSDDESDDDDDNHQDHVDEEMGRNDNSHDTNVDKPDKATKADSKTKPLPTLSPSKLLQYNKDDAKQTIATLLQERDAIAKNANMAAIQEYRKKEADYLSRVAEFDAVSALRNEARKVHEELRRKRLEMFMDGFGQITLKLKEMYQMITLGGDAELELVDSLDPFAEGIVFSVRPPKKSWKNIANLSGGEKTLSSLALVFALHHYKPTPLYVMDEIDAALDFKNVSIVANYIKERTKNAQFIIISLRNNMFELADRLVGIYKTNNCTKSVTINPSAFGKPPKLKETPGTPAFKDKTNIISSPMKNKENMIVD